MDDAARVRNDSRSGPRAEPGAGTPRVPRPDFTGDFETHVTVAAAGAGTDEADGALQRWAVRRGAKYTRILLDAGHTPDQPMLTLRGSGTLADQRAAAAVHTAELRRAGFDVVRVKIEAAPWNADVPRTSREAEVLPSDCYFEHHVKLVLTSTAAIARVAEIGVRYNARVSRNARRLRPEVGGHERFVTQRCHSVGSPEAERRLGLLVRELADAGFPVMETEREFVVQDDNPGVDAGWLGVGGDSR